MFYGSKYLIIGFVYIIISVFLFEKAYTDVCANSCQNNTDCVFKAQESIVLVCTESENIMNWYKATDNSTIYTPATGLMNTNQTNFNLSKCNIPGNMFRVDFLTLNGLSASDSGEGIYVAKEKPDSSFFVCKMNIFVYDLTNYDGSITIQNNTRPINESSSVLIDSFDDPLEYEFTIEHLPLDDLLVDNKKVKSSQSCETKNYPWLNCLQSEPLEVKIPRCASNYTLPLSYSFNNRDRFLNGNNSPVALPNPTVYNYFISFTYPPKVKNQNKEVFYNSTDESIVLTCEVECGYPNIFTYTWFDSNTKVFLYVSNTTNQYKHAVNVTFEVHCRVSNTIKTNYINESTTYFVITNASIIDPTSTTGLKDWEVAVIIVNCVLALVIIGGLLFYIMIFRRKSNEKTLPKDEEVAAKNFSGNVYDNNDQNPSKSTENISIRQRQLDDELVENPVYGKPQLDEYELDDASKRSGSIKENNNQTLV